MALRRIITPLRLKLLDKQKVAEDIYTFSFQPEKNIRWKAGQYGILEIKLPNGKTARKMFSIASAPNEKIISIATRIKKDSSGVFKSSLLNIKKNEYVTLRGPMGPMRIKGPGSYAFLASGIGITPFRAILKQLSEEKTDIETTLFFVGNKESHYFKGELEETKVKLKHCQIVYIYKPQRITGQIIEDTLGKEVHSTTYFLSGSPTLVKSYYRTLRGLGVARSHIKRNPFWGQSKKT
jgi:ferredoxin-NADP reductase